MMTRAEDIEEEQISKMESGITTVKRDSTPHSAKLVKLEGFFTSLVVVTTLQKVVAELMGTYLLMFCGCGSIIVNKLYGGVITHPGIGLVWGLSVMVLIYSVGHVSGAHFNPAVTLALAVYGRFPWKEVPLYIIAQLLGSILASCTLDGIFNVTSEAYFGTLPVGSVGQSLAIEIIISFLLMFVVSAVATDNRAIGNMLGVVVTTLQKIGNMLGVAVGMTITLNVFMAGPISGASMNPARSIGPAISKRTYRGLWVYILGPIVGTIAGGFAYNLIRLTDKPIQELAKSASFCTKC